MRPSELFWALRDDHGARPTPGRLTFAELAAPASELADLLSRLNASGQRVAAMISDPVRRAEVVLAVAAADATLVPLSERWPAERRRRALELARVSLLVTDAPGPAIVSGHQPEVISGPGGLSILAVDPAAPASPEPALYVLFTSGSTGAPKGVRMSVDAAYQHFRIVPGWLGLADADVVMQFAELCFDVSQEEIWPTLLAGAALAVAPGSPPGFSALARRVNEAGVTVLQLPTAYWRSWTQAIERRQVALPTLRLVVIGGEAAFMPDAHRWRAGPLGHVRLINSYGPTEAGISATAYEIPAEPGPRHGPLPIGEALPGRQLTVADGELVISGSCLFDGYEGPAAAPASAAYRTGDLVAWDSERQAYLFTGRADREIKIHGSRVSLDEAEAALLAIDGVRQAKLLPGRTADADQVLAACLALSPELERAGWPALRGVLAGQVIPAMVPSFALLLPELPTNPAGKVDGAECGRLLTAANPTLTIG